LILLVSVPCFNSYLENPSQILQEKRVCPICTIRRLARHDAYLRWVLESSERWQIPIFRLRCRPCHVTYTLLPDLLIPYRRYLAPIIEKAIGDYVTTDASCRRLAVELSGAEIPAGRGVTDSLLSIRLKPSYQSIFGWIKQACDLAESYSGALLAWNLRLRPDHHGHHQIAIDTQVVRAKGRSESKRGQLQNLVILKTIAVKILGPGKLGWMGIMGRFVSSVMGQIPWRSAPQPHKTGRYRNPPEP
jgi:hypothetical protein